MKILPVLLAATLTAHAAPSDPGKVAVDFLEKVRLRQLNLAPGADTALSAQTAAGKKRQIERSLERMARDLGSDPLEVGAVKLDENFAAVLVRKVGGFDSSRLQIFPVALVKRGAEWLVAPVPASFENSGASYAAGLRQRLAALEDWMLREQVTDLQQLREHSANRMREKIEGSLPSAEVRRMDAKEFGERFLAACGRRDLPALLGFLGGLADKLPDDWPARMKSAERAVAADGALPRPWRLLTSPEVARVLVDHDDDPNDGHLSVACLNPEGTGQPKIEVMHLGLSKADDGIWQINPPASFLQHPGDSADDSDDELDSELRDAFPASWLAAHPPKPQATPEGAHRALIETLGSGGFPALLGLTQIDGEAPAAREACLEAAQVARMLQGPAALRHALPLVFQSNETSAVGLFQFFSPRDPDQFDGRALYFEKSAGGWLWSPEPDSATREIHRAWVEQQSAVWKARWQPMLLADSPLLTAVDSQPAPTEAEARLVVEQWLEATRKGDVKAALARVARLNTAQSDSLVLQNLGYEIAAARRSSEISVITEVSAADPWTVVGAKVNQGEKTSFPLYPVVGTPQGAKILIEIDLFASGNRGREFLNKAAFERLGKTSNTVGALRNLCSEYQRNLEKPRPIPAPERSAAE